MFYTNKYGSPLGDMTLASDGNSLIGLWFDGQKFFADNLPQPFFERDLPIFDLTKKWLDVYFSGKAPNFTPPLDPCNVSPFRKRVWEILLTIPFGQTFSYGEIAKRLSEDNGKSVSARAVGGAVGHNPIAVIIPCHRVIATDGKPTGYAGGVNRKIELLKAEGVDMSKLIAPQKLRIRTNSHKRLSEAETPF